VPYPYPKTTIVLGSADEEYPMMVNDGSNIGSSSAKALPENAFTGFVARTRSCTAGSRSTWASTRSGIPFMDEGWTTAFEYLRNREVLGVPKKPTRCSRISGRGQGRAGRCVGLMTCRSITPHDSLWGQSADLWHSTSTGRPRSATWR
jgi:hypothetical protein